MQYTHSAPLDVALNALPFAVQTPVDACAFAIQVPVYSIALVVEPRLQPVAFPIQLIGKSRTIVVSSAIRGTVETRVEPIALAIEALIDTLAPVLQSILDAVALAIQITFDTGDSACAAPLTQSPSIAIR